MYQQAAALLPADPAAALGRVQSLRARWPGSALRYEVDVRVVQALVALGRTGQASQEARDFLRRYPRSPRRAEMEALASPRVPTAGWDQ